MSPRCLRPLAALTSVVCLAFSGMAQTNENTGVFKGEVLSEQGQLVVGYRVELVSLDYRGNTYRTDVQLDGTFQFRDVPTGTYSLNVITMPGDQLHSELVTVVQQSGRLTVRLAGRADTIGAPGTVSMKQLLHPPDRKAFQAAASAQRLSEAGHPEKAAQELEKAIRISPEYADAYNNLAIQHMRMGRYEEACQELVKSLEIAGPHPQVLSNLAFAQRYLGRYQEAVESARAALKIDRGSAPAHLVIGSILAAYPSTRAEGIKHLEIAAETLESAKATLDRALKLTPR